jgi:branched-chain amino acid transport system ATP-binding protein
MTSAWTAAARGRANGPDFPAALEAIGLTRRFGGLLAVSDVSLTVETGTLHAVIGPNGAGKSTLINLLSGELTPTDGRIRLDGVDVAGHPVWRLARAGIGRTFQRTNVMPDMTVLENVRLAVQAAAVRGFRLLYPARRATGLTERARTALRQVSLEAAAKEPAGTLSHGQLRLLEIAIALAAEPRVLLLDEPLAGLGPEESAPLAALLRTLARDHAVLLVEHDMDVVFAVADRLTVMVDGRVLAQGRPAEIRESAAVRDAYLGHAVPTGTTHAP